MGSVAFISALVAKALSTLCTTARQYLAAVAVCHSFTEAVLLFSVELLWLIRSQHTSYPPFRETLHNIACDHSTCGGVFFAGKTGAKIL